MLPLHSAFALIFPFILPAFGQLTEVCNPGTGLCFNQAFDEATESTFGFVLPTEGIFTDDFITTITTPVPYGFVGFGIGNAGKIPVMSVAGVMTAFTIPGPIGTLQNAMLMQQSTLSTNGTQLVPNSSGGLVSISKLSFWNATSATFIFRCQNCSLAAPPAVGGFHLAVFQSYEPGIYPAFDALNATFKTDKAAVSGFDIHNIAALRTTDYDAFLVAAGFV
ncbi:hypothetical protein K438DRAFT_1935531 [Mycena galopus ATCC 62051]|nr:hypothetical protein K438DRAFT_1935531 [Mycena galopus ATCC 62051]